MNSLFVSSKIIMMLSDLSLLQNPFFFRHFLACKLKWWGVGLAFMSLKKATLCFLNPDFTLNKAHILPCTF